MSGNTERYLELLDRRIGLLGVLADALLAAREDIVCLDVDGLERRISQQENLCRQVSALNAQLDRLQKHCATKSAAVSGAVESRDASTLPVTDVSAVDRELLSARLAEASLRMQTAQGRVKELNDTHQALLRRCRRTAGALLHSYATFTETYSDPFHDGRGQL